MPCGVTITPFPKLASTAPVVRSNLKIGSSGVLSQSTGPPPAVPAPQRSYAQTFPSVGSMSMPAVVPHLRLTIEAGFGSPLPVIGFPAVVLRAFDDWARARVLRQCVVKRIEAPTARADHKIRDSAMVSSFIQPGSIAQFK